MLHVQGQDPRHVRFGQEEVWRWRKEGETGAAQMMETEEVSCIKWSVPLCADCYVYVCTEFAQHTGSKHRTVSIERQETRQLQSYLKLRLGQLGPGDVITAVAQGLRSLWG